MITVNPRHPAAGSHFGIDCATVGGLDQARQRASMLASFADSGPIQTLASGRHWLQHTDPQLSTRAAQNIAAWREYLPEDCVAAMIADGWHWST
jgi:hypothetical protein